MTMASRIAASRIAARYVSRRFSGGGKILSEEEKAAENVYIKKMEQERLAKAAQKGPQAAEATGTGAPASEAPSGPSGPEPSTANVSTDKNRNYAIVAGVITIAGAVGWYLQSNKKKPEEVQD